MDRSCFATPRGDGRACKSPHRLGRLHFIIGHANDGANQQAKTPAGRCDGIGVLSPVRHAGYRSISGVIGVGNLRFQNSRAGGGAARDVPERRHRLRASPFPRSKTMRALFDSVRYPSALVLVQRAIYDVRPHAAAEKHHCNAQSEKLLPGQFHFGAPCRTPNLRVAGTFPSFLERPRTNRFRHSAIAGCHGIRMEPLFIVEEPALKAAICRR